MKRILFILFATIYCLNISAQLNTDRLTAIGRNALYFDDYVLSIQYFNQVIKVKPYLAEPYLFRAIAKIELGDYVGAEHDCDMAIHNNPFMPGAYYTRGYIYRQQEKFAEAEQDFTEALTFAPDNRTYILLRADVRSQLKHYEDALADIDYLLRRDPHAPSLLFEKGVISMANGDTTLALTQFAEATHYDSQNAANWSAKGLTNLMLGNETDALNDLNKAIELGSRWAGDYINRGILHYKNHNYRAALADYDKAVEFNPQAPQCYFNRGLLRAEVGDYNRAMADFDKVLDLNPENYETYYQRGVVYLKLQSWKEAIHNFEQLIEQYPYFTPAYYLIAQAKTALNDHIGAEQYIQKARSLELTQEEFNQLQQLNTDVQLADNQPQKKDRKKEFSSNAAQNQTEEDTPSQYKSEARGSVQNKYADVINEPNIVLSYYPIAQTLRRTSYFHYALDEFNHTEKLPAALKTAVQELSLTAEMAELHFSTIDQLSNLIAWIESQSTTPELPYLYFARAVEFALVQDYASALDDCTQALVLCQQDHSFEAIATFCRANWRGKYFDYQRSTGLISNEQHVFESEYRRTYELILLDYDHVIELLPDFSFVYYNKANLLCQQRDFQTAIQLYTQAIAQDADFAEAYFNRGLTRIYIDDVEAGLQDLSKAGELGIYQAYNLITRFK